MRYCCDLLCIPPDPHTVVRVVAVVREYMVGDSPKDKWAVLLVSCLWLISE